MHKPRAIALLTGLLFLGAVAALSEAQLPPNESPKTSKEPKDEPAKVKPTLPKGWSKLGLTDAQKQELYKTRARFQEQIQRLQEQLEALKAEEKTELEKILTPGQKARLKEVLEGDKVKEPKDPQE